MAGVGGAPEAFEGVGELVLGEPRAAIEDVHADVTPDAGASTTTSTALPDGAAAMALSR